MRHTCGRGNKNDFKKSGAHSLRPGAPVLKKLDNVQAGFRLIYVYGVATNLLAPS